VIVTVSECELCVDVTGDARLQLEQQTADAARLARLEEDRRKVEQDKEELVRTIKGQHEKELEQIREQHERKLYER